MKTDWTKRIELLRAEMAQRQPSISMEIVMLVFGYKAKSAALWALREMERIGAVEHRGGKWYLTK